jgi:hypothetical protein
MIAPASPPPDDIDALARRLPQRSPSPQRSRALRAALLDAAQPTAPRTPSRWTVAWAGIAVATTAAAVVLVLRGAPSPKTTLGPSAPAPAISFEPAAPPPPVELAINRPPTADDRPPTATAAHTDPTVVANPPTPSKPSPPVRAVAPSRKPLAVDRDVSGPAPDRAAPPPTTDAPDAIRATAPPPTERAPGAPTSASADIAAAERAFRDGLQSLLAGDPRAARAPLERACAAPSSSREDSCYWAAVAWLRSGDRTRAAHGFTDLLSRWPASTHAGEASVSLGWLLLDSGDRASARTRFSAAATDAMPSVRAEANRGLAAAH